MKIDRISLQHVRIPLVEPFKISNGEIREKDGIVVGVFADGMDGYGEASPMAGSFYSDDTPESVWDGLANDLIPAVLSRAPRDIEAVNAVLDEVPGSAFARAGLETAFWDLFAQRDRKPLYELLGGKEKAIESGLAVGIYPDVRELLKAIER